MALFLGTYAVPTNKKLRVNNTDVTVVMCNGIVVWRYVKGSTGTGTGTGTTKPPVGVGGTWQPVPYSAANRVVTTYTPAHKDAQGDMVAGVWNFVATANGQVLVNLHNLPSPYNSPFRSPSGVLYSSGAINHSNTHNLGVENYYNILRFVPTP